MKTLAELAITSDINAVLAALAGLRVQESETLFETFALLDGAARALAQFFALSFELAFPGSGVAGRARAWLPSWGHYSTIALPRGATHFRVGWRVG